MKNSTRISVSACLLLAVLCGASGCCTPAIWKDTAATTWKPVNTPPRVWLTVDRNDALLAFEQQEKRAKDPRQRTVACWASSTAELAAVGKRSVKKLTNSLPLLRPLEVARIAEVPDRAALEPGSPALWNTNTFEVTVALADRVFGPRRLPTTRQELQTRDRILMTPIGLAVDAVLIGGAVALVGAASMAGASPP